MAIDKIEAEYELQGFLEDTIFQSHMLTAASTRFQRLLAKVYKRLPDAAQDYVRKEVNFVFQDPALSAINVPVEGVVVGKTGTLVPYKKDLIVVFSPAFVFSDGAFIGLLAHEIAHSMRQLDDNDKNEKAADAQVRKWGFGKELRALRSEQEKVRQLGRPS